MNNKSLFYTLLILIISNLTILSQPVKSDSSLFPLALGNKYIYFKDYVPVDMYTGYGNHRYSIVTYEITNTLSYNNINFYNIYGKWLGFDKPTNKIYLYYLNVTTPCIEVYLSLSPLGALSSQSFLGATYPSYQYTRTYFGGPGSITGYEDYYAYNIGMGYQIINNRTSHGGSDEYWTLIGMISNDPDNPFLKQDEAAPVISPPVCGILPDSNKYFINTTISHKYSREKNYFLKVSQGVSFINQAELEYFYKKDNDTLPHNFVNLSMATENIFGRIINIRKDLIQQGYDIYYKIKAVDKALKPHFVYYPESGFNKLEIDEYCSINYYPLAVGNKWLYNIYDISNGAMTFVRRMEVDVIGETTLSNNKKYFIVQRDNSQQYERIDTLSGIVYTANTQNPDNIIDYPSNYLYAKTDEGHHMLRNNITKIYVNNNSSISAFNNADVSAKMFTVVDDTSFSFVLAENMGLFSEKYKMSEQYYLSELKYAKIGEFEYGKNLLPQEYLIRYPMHIGDKYTYARSTKSYIPNVFIPYDTLTVSVDKDTILSNNQKYFKLVSKEEDSYVRIDSSNGNIYKAKIIDGNMTDLLMDNIITEEDSIQNIYFMDEYNKYRYNQILYSSAIVGQNAKCIKIKQVNNENIFFIRCDNYGIISSCTKRNSTEGIFYLYQDLIDIYTITNGLRPASPTSYHLSQNYPNPFNPSTNINFTLPNSEFVTLKIYDILGKEVTTLVNEELNAGNYTKTWNANNLSSGVYFYKLTAGKFSETKKMMLVR